MKKTKEDWLKCGYEVFAISGSNHLKIELLAKNVGVSKSSFYHFFAEIDVFIEELLLYHLKQAEIIAIKERNANHINPDLINILVEHKLDLLFSRQLRIYQNIPLFNQTLIHSNQIIGNEFIRIWRGDLNIKLSPNQLNSLFGLALENFFLQINLENLHFDWLQSYFSNLNHIVRQFE